MAKISNLRHEVKLKQAIIDDPINDWDICKISLNIIVLN